jgi:hypothetical protein
MLDINAYEGVSFFLLIFGKVNQAGHGNITRGVACFLHGCIFVQKSLASGANVQISSLWERASMGLSYFLTQKLVIGIRSLWLGSFAMA